MALAVLARRQPTVEKPRAPAAMSRAGMRVPPWPPSATTPLTMARTDMAQSTMLATSLGLAGRLPGMRGT